MGEVERRADDPLSGAKASNRLTIGHLLLWTATAAASIAVLRPDHAVQELRHSDASEMQRQRTYEFLVISVGPLLGAGLTGFALFLTNRLRGISAFPSQPCHWLLVAVGLLSLVFVISLASARNAGPGPLSESLEFLIPVSFVVSTVVTGGMLYWAAYIGHYPQRWRIALRFVGASLVLIFTCFFCIALHDPWWWGIPAIGAYLLAPIFVLVASLRDIRLGAQYDFFHWTGILAFQALAVIGFVSLWLGW